MKSLFVMLAAGALSLASFAKLPALSDEAKAKAAETAAKAVHTGKVEGYLLCKYQDKSASHYYKTAKSAGKETKPAGTLPACADPGAFVYVPAAPAAVSSAPVATAVASATPAVAAGKDSKKP